MKVKENVLTQPETSQLQDSLDILSGFLNATTGLLDTSNGTFNWISVSNNNDIKLFEDTFTKEEFLSRVANEYIDVIKENRVFSFYGNNGKQYMVLFTRLRKDVCNSISLWILFNTEFELTDIHKKLIGQCKCAIEHSFYEDDDCDSRSLRVPKNYSESNNPCRMLFESSPVGILYYNKDLVVTVVNNRFCKTFEVNQEQVQGVDLSKHNLDEVRSALMAPFQGLEGLYEGNYLTTTSKKRLNLQVKTAPVLNINNQVTGAMAIIQDVSELSNTKIALEESDTRLRTLINSTPDFICFKDGQGRWVEANQSMLSIFGLHQNQYAGKHYLELAEIVPQHRTALQCCHESDLVAWKKKKTINLEEFITDENGDIRIYDVIKVPLFYVDGSRKGLVILGRDITARKKAETDNIEKETRFKSVAMHTNDLIYEWDSKENSFKLHGNLKWFINTNEAPGSFKQMLAQIHPQDRLFLKNRWRINGEKNKAWKEEFRIVLANGEVRYVKGSGIIEKIDKQKGWYKAYGTLTNITHEKQLIHTLKEALDIAENNHSKLRSLLDIIPDLIFVFDKDGYFRDFHAKHEDNLLVSSKLFIDQNVKDVLPDYLATLTLEKITKVIQNKELETYNYTLFQNGEERVYESRMVYFREDETICIVRDVTHAKEVERELLAAKDKAEESDKLKSAFLANISHEIRTPLNGIMGFAELLKDEEVLPESRSFYLDIIVKSGHQLLGIINDVLEISRIETGQVSVIKTDIDVSEMVRSTVDFFQVSAKSKKIKIKLNLPRKTDILIKGDQHKIIQVLNNLISNAIKFTNSGGIVNVGYKVKNNHLLFFVKDNGMGIDPRYHTMVFERFRQVDDKGASVKGGSGLGLSICKSLLELMGGDIWVESQIGMGSCFYFTLKI